MSVTDQTRLMQLRLIEGLSREELGELVRFMLEVNGEQGFGLSVSDVSGWLLAAQR